MSGDAKNTKIYFCLSVCHHDNLSKTEPILMIFFKMGNLICEAEFEDERNQFSGSGDMTKK